MASMLRDIVTALNADPFNMSLSLVTFDEKTSYELLETLNAVLVFLDKKHKVDVREESPENLYARVADFLHILGYKSTYDAEFQQGLVSGEKRVVHPVLHWLLTNLESLKKKAYLANFLVSLEVPEDFLKDEAMAAFWQQYRELQAQFKITHAALEQQKVNSVTPHELKKEIQQLESEKDQLQQKIAGLKSKTSSKEGFQQLFDVTSALRKEQEEEARLAERVREQRMQLDHFEQQCMVGTQRLHELRQSTRDSESAGAETMLKVLREEANKNKETAERYEREINEKRARLQQLEGVLGERPVGPQDISELETLVGTAMEDIRRLQEKLERQTQPNSSLAIYQQQAALVSKKKELLQRELKDMEGQRSTLSQALSEKEREYEEQRGHRFLSKDDFKKYAQELKERTAKFKRLKADLQETRGELAILTRTEQLLQQKDAEAARHVAATEQKMGIAGYQEAETDLEKVSAEKAAVDRQKGVALDEMSGVVLEIQNKLKAKKNKLAPQITALRGVRAKLQELEAVYNEKKGAYEQTQLALDAGLAKLRQEVEHLQAEADGHESRFHEANLKAQLADSLIQRANDEVKAATGKARYSPEYATLSACLSAKMGQMEAQSRELRAKQRRVREDFEGRLRQRDMFAAVTRLLQCKLKVTSQEMANMRHTGDSFRVENTTAYNRLIVE